MDISTDILLRRISVCKESRYEIVEFVFSTLSRRLDQLICYSTLRLLFNSISKSTPRNRRFATRNPRDISLDHHTSLL
ncbi:hypothetical protein L1887_40372 [Cichorium endivia]|nr:hypothetical protein L1887_40372 [Cichorium endivia]